ncbi:helix-turn-helix transcriptional regulator [Kaistia sp. MMO-174]|uniref:helix-turn-helix transcriptional regulator n=1 Tax=Kaistia sp. MMO-174 TaxID=3081256 RepID=UPI00301B5151
MSITSPSELSLLDLLEPQRDESAGARAFVSVALPTDAPAPANKRARAKNRRVAEGSIVIPLSVPAGTDAGAQAYLSVAQVARRFSVSVPTIWRWAKTRPEFPKPVVLSPGTTRWRLADLVAFEQNLGASA